MLSFFEVYFNRRNVPVSFAIRWRGTLDWIIWAWPVEPINCPEIDHKKIMVVDFKVRLGVKFNRSSISWQLNKKPKRSPKKQRTIIQDFPFFHVFSFIYFFRSGCRAPFLRIQEWFRRNSILTLLGFFYVVVILLLPKNLIFVFVTKAYQLIILEAYSSREIRSWTEWKEGSLVFINAHC